MFFFNPEQMLLQILSRPVGRKPPPDGGYDFNRCTYGFASPRVCGDVYMHLREKDSEAEGLAALLRDSDSIEAMGSAPREFFRVWDTSIGS